MSTNNTNNESTQMTKKNYITACISLAVAVGVMIFAADSFLAARELTMPVEGPGVTEIRMLSEWNPHLLGTAGDTPVYVMQGEKEGGSMLLLGGTHANEPSGYMSAFLFIETGVVEEGTVYVIPYANRSAMTHNDPGEGNLQYFSLNTQSGTRVFRFGSRATNPVDQWPDPDVYLHQPSGQRLSGSETRNLNRNYPGLADGQLTERIGFAICELIRQEDIGISYDLHEASPEYPVINATVAHPDDMDIAAMGTMNLLIGGMDIALESSPEGLRGLSHREWGDHTDTMPILMETANASMGRLRGATSSEQVLAGVDAAYMRATELGKVYVGFTEDGHPIEERCGRHLEAVKEYTTAYSEANPGKAVVYSGVPGYDELYRYADPGMLGGPLLGSFLL